MRNKQYLSRRDFLKLATISLGGLALRPRKALFGLPDFQKSERLGRVLAKTDIMTHADFESSVIGTLYEDNIVTWLKEVSGPNLNQLVQRWVETPDGWIWAPRLQPVANHPNTPVESLPQTSKGSGMWAEVTVPYVDLALENPPARSPWLQNTQYPRLYYSQVMWIDQIRKDDQGQVWYRANQLYGSYGDRFWVAAEAFRPVTPDEITPINPEVEDKRVIVDVTYETLSCYEGKTEVYFCRISSGAKFDAGGIPVDKWATPLGVHRPWRKLISLHMSGGTTGAGFDLPGIGWTVLFSGEGYAIHSTFWHNNFGVWMSHGCVNALPEDAKWIFRWTNPAVPYDPGEIKIPMPGGTIVEVREG